MGFAAALSEHPDATEAAGEVIGRVLEALGTEPDLAVLFVTPPHIAAFKEIVAAVRRLLRPHCLLGATAIAVLGENREVEQTPGVSLWAGAGIGHVTPVRLDALQTASGAVLDPLPSEARSQQRTLLLIPDPFSFPLDVFMADAASADGLVVIGGLASASGRAGGNLLALDDKTYDSGAVGALLPAGVQLETVVSQGCRPIGRPYTVTRAAGNFLHELGGQSALARLRAIAGSATESDRQLLSGGVHLGVVVDEHKLDFGRGDFLIRAVMGADPGSGALAVGDVVPVGATVQFQVRDAKSATEDLRTLLSGKQAEAALVFSCNGRGMSLFDAPHHDAATISELTATMAIGGMFCAGEIGPIGGKPFLHGFTASILLFR